MCIYCDYCVYHHKFTELVSLYTLDIGLQINIIIITIIIVVTAIVVIVIIVICVIVIVVNVIIVTVIIVTVSVVTIVIIKHHLYIVIRLNGTFCIELLLIKHTI